MAENIWTSLSNQIAETTATAGQNVVAVHGRRHPSSGIIIAADAVVTANPGCIIQIVQGLRAKGSPIQVLHIVELLDQAYRGK